MKRSWLITILICMLLLGGGGAVLFLPQVVPFDQCSDVYKKYAGMDGVDATFIRDYKVNDTVFVDVTLLEAKYTTAWEELCKDFDIASITQFPVEFRESLTASNSYSLRVIKDSTDTDCGVEYSRNVIIFSYPKMSMCIFHNMNYKQYNAIVDKNVKNISN